MQSTYEAALEYSRADLRVVPCKPQSKEPILNDWPRRATTSPSQIRDWFEGHPERNIGILTGGGVFAIDVDEEQGVKSLNSFIAGRSWPHTATAETGNDGFHFLFRADVQIPTQTGFRPGLDLRGESAKIVVAPSVHPDTGAVYRWISHPLDGIATAPRWLKSWIASETTARTNKARSAGSPLLLNLSGDVEALTFDVVERFPVARRGTRNDVMVKVLCSLLGRGQDVEVTAEVALRWWQHYYDRGTIGTNPKEAPRTIEKSIAAILKSGTLHRASGQDHSSRVAKISPSSQQMAVLESLRQGQGRDSLHTGVTSPGLESAICRTDHESWFVEALLVHFTYEMSKAAEDAPLPMTNAQLSSVIESRHGEKLNPNQIERLKRKYITREDQPASRLELVVQTYTGSSYMKRPSEYALTGLADLFLHEEPIPTSQARDSLHTGVTSYVEEFAECVPQPSTYHLSAGGYLCGIGAGG